MNIHSLTFDLATAPPGDGNSVVDNLGTRDSGATEKIRKIRQEKRITK